MRTAAKSHSRVWGRCIARHDSGPVGSGHMICGGGRCGWNCGGGCGSLRVVVAVVTTPEVWSWLEVPPIELGIETRLAEGGVLSVDGVDEAARPFFCGWLAHRLRRPLVVVLGDVRQVDEFHRNLTAFVPGAEVFPAWELAAGGDGLPSMTSLAGRLRVVGALAGGKVPPVIVTSAAALCARTFGRTAMARYRRVLRVGERVERETLMEWLRQVGYSPQVQVSEPGDVACRGGIVDFYPLDRADPVRVELVGDQIESIREFDALSQCSRTALPEVAVLPAGEPGLLRQRPEEAAGLWEWLPADTVMVMEELSAPEPVGASPASPLMVSWAEVVRAWASRVELREQPNFEEAGAVHIRMTGLDAYRPLEMRVTDVAVQEESRRQFFEQMRRWQSEGWRVVLLLGTAGAQQRFGELWREQFGEAAAAPPSRLAELSRGFGWWDARLVVVTDAEVFGRPKTYRPRTRFHAVAAPADWSDFAVGDYVVHLQHGIGRFLGLKTIEVNTRATAADAPLTEAAVARPVRQEVMVLEYANQARLYVPVEQAHLVARYISPGKGAPPLHELGGSVWGRQKSAAEQAIRDLASELLEIQAARATLAGHAFPPDTPWQVEFEAAFPYEETPDQLTAIADVKRDMEALRPMDRLVCGDVGYGKTEVAIRAAFKAVMGGRQVAVLVPTTILAEQHWNTFRERMAGYPITVEMLSRFRTTREQKDVLRRLAAGQVDIVIGTHRLLSEDVQFKNLGLVVIDEEQRFGVRHKERFKQLRRLVDVLTLSATPIPRTLYMALTGLREMSTVQTPPQDRLPVETIVAPYDERLIREAIERELARGGQVYFVHNRVQSIEAVARRLEQLLNGRGESQRRVRLAIGHGQMREHELEEVMHRFVRGDVDVLVCTTIIESGLDIPNANTIIIDRADRFGLSDLYQLRGRVGRYKHQAYAYILLPRHAALVQAARKRIRAIRQYSSLGSGFKIAMRDLEIRGAGNILGPEQSGHMAAIGFDLYCQLLQESIAALKGEPRRRPPAVTLKLDFLQMSAGAEGTWVANRIPADYIPDAALRIQAYRRIAACTDEAALKQIRQELRDRYGPLPEEVELLLGCMEIKLLAGRAGIDTVETREEKVILCQRGQLYQREGRFPRLRGKKPLQRLTEIKKLLAGLQDTSSSGRKEAKLR